MSSKGRLGSSGYGIRRKGSFAGKTITVIATRLDTRQIFYTPGVVPEDVKQLRRYIRDELNAISRAITEIASGHLAVAYTEPIRPRDGDVRLADGTGWDPGSGRGVYVYYSNTWNLLG